MTISTGGWGGGPIVSGGWGGGAGTFVPPVDITGLTPSVATLLLRPLLSVSLEDRPAQPLSLGLIPVVQALSQKILAALNSLGIRPAVSTTPSERATVTPVSLIPRLGTGTEAPIELEAKALKAGVSTDAEEKPAAETKNLKPKLKG
jgi:hypothetical protein